MTVFVDSTVRQTDSSNCCCDAKRLGKFGVGSLREPSNVLHALRARGPDAYGDLLTEGGEVFHKASDRELALSSTMSLCSTALANSFVTSLLINRSHGEG
jgi:hypothetical protein